MVNKKYTLTLGLLGLFTTASFAQKTFEGTDADNSWVYSTDVARKVEQQNNFLNGAYPYPSKPRHMWELGLGIGPSFVYSPVDPKLGYGASISLRKAFGHILSIRGQYGYFINYGQDYRTRDINGVVLPQAVKDLYLSANLPYVHNYKATGHNVAVDVIASLNTLSGYRGNNKVDWYALLGWSYNYVRTGVNALDANGKAYNYTDVPFKASRSELKKVIYEKTNTQSNDLFSAVNERYETLVDGRSDEAKRSDITGGAEYLTRHAMDVGAGVSYKISKRFNIGLEQKFIMFFSNSDVVAATQLQPQGRNVAISSTQLRLNFNLGSFSRRIEPLWWVNPNNYLYAVAKDPKDLVDTDGDGVADQFDLEPNTPAGCPVDVKGRTLDTDGDGVPDCKDKQILTPNTWFPVDADGVGVAPDPECCKNRPVVEVSACKVTYLPSVSFTGTSVALTSAAESALASAAAQLNANPTCKVKIVAYGSGNKKAQQLSWDRANKVRSFLVEKQGISESRIIFQYGNDGNANTVDLIPTQEEGLSTVPAPFPHLQKS